MNQDAKTLDPKALETARKAFFDHGGNVLALTSPDRFEAAISAYLSALRDGEATEEAPDPVEKFLRENPLRPDAPRYVGDLADEIGSKIEALLSEERRGAFIGLHQVRAIKEIQDCIRAALTRNVEPRVAWRTSGGEITQLQEVANRWRLQGRPVEGLVLASDGDGDFFAASAALAEFNKVGGTSMEALEEELFGSALSATPPVAQTGTVGSQTEALRAFAESFHFTVTDSFYKDAYLGIHEPDSVTIRLVNNSLESAHIAKLEARRKAALSAPTVEGAGL